MNEKGEWRISPAYDLTFSIGPGGEHCTMIMGNGRNPGTADLLKLANASKIDKPIALNIIDEVKEAISKWSQFAKEAGVSRQSSKNIASTLQKIK